jgi:hypothetical protein
VVHYQLLTRHLLPVLAVLAVAVAQVLLWVAAVADIQAGVAALQPEIQRLMQVAEADRGLLPMLAQ